MLLPTLARPQRTRIITFVAQGERAFDEIAPRSIAVTSKKNAATEIKKQEESHVTKYGSHDTLPLADLLRAPGLRGATSSQRDCAARSEVRRRSHRCQRQARLRHRRSYFRSLQGSRGRRAALDGNPKCPA